MELNCTRHSSARPQSNASLRACGKPAAGAWGGIMFHKCIADGKKLFLWISVLEWGTRSSVSWPRVGFWVKMRVPCLDLLSNRPPTNLHSVVILFEVWQFCRVELKVVFNQGRSTGSMPEVMADMANRAYRFFLVLKQMIFFIYVQKQWITRFCWFSTSIAWSKKQSLWSQREFCLILSSCQIQVIPVWKNNTTHWQNCQSWWVCFIINNVPSPFV